MPFITNKEKRKSRVAWFLWEKNSIGGVGFSERGPLGVHFIQVFE